MDSLSAQPGLRPLLVAEIASSFALAVQAMAIPWLVLTNGGSATDVGVVMTAGLAPAIVLGIPLGGLVERVGARRWMIGSDVVSVALVTAIVILAEADALPLWALAALVFLLGSLRTPYMGSQQELLSKLVGDREGLLARATSILQGANRTSLLLGPPIAGVLVTAMGAAPTLVVTIVTLIVVIAILRFAVPRETRQVTASRPRLLDGLRELRRDRLVSSWISGSTFSEAAYQALFVAIPILTVHRYDATAAAAGVLTGAFGGGAVAGSFAAIALATRVRSVRLALVGKFLQALTFVGLILAVPLWGAVALIAALGIANGLTNGPSSAVMIPRLRERHRGNALTAAATIIMSGGAVGSAAAGPALDHTSAEALFTVAAILMGVSCTLFVRGAVVASRGGTPPASEGSSDRPDSETDRVESAAGPASRTTG
jgi:predicted MFS family arabinose efflux permease